MARIYSYNDLDESERQQAFSLLPSIEIELEEEDTIEEDDIEEMAVRLACSFIKNDESNYGDIYEQVYNQVTGEKPESNPYDTGDEFDDDLDDED